MQDVSEEVCIIDTILEEQADQQGMQDTLTEELAECAEEQQEADMKLCKNTGEENMKFYRW